MQESIVAASMISGTKKPLARPILPRAALPNSETSSQHSTENMEVALKSSADPPAVLNMSRLRSESFNSDDGEEHDSTTSLDKPVATQTGVVSAAGGNLQVQPRSSQPAPSPDEPVDMASLLAPLLGVQVSY
jgi:hypothetical protein